MDSGLLRRHVGLTENFREAAESESLLQYLSVVLLTGIFEAQPWDTADHVIKISNEVSCVIRQGSNQRGTNFRRNERTLSSTAIYCTSAVILIHQPPKSGIVLLLRLGSLTLLYRHLLFLVFNVVLNQRSLACLTLWESKHLLEINLQRLPLTRALQGFFFLLKPEFRKRQSTVSMVFSSALTEKVVFALHSAMKEQE